MQYEVFAADCGRCFGLCCVALSFQRSADFGHDKPAGQPCHFLEPSFGCRIHSQRDALGYEGCEAFDCLGAGQLASAEFAGKNWQRDPVQARLLYARFADLLKLQEIRSALVEAGALDLDEDAETERLQLLDSLASDQGTMTAPRNLSDVVARARAFITQLTA